MNKTTALALKNKNHRTLVRSPKAARRLKKMVRSRRQFKFLSRRAIKIKATKRRIQFLRAKSRKQRVKYTRMRSILEFGSLRKYRTLLKSQIRRTTVLVTSVLARSRRARSRRFLYWRARRDLHSRIKVLKRVGARVSRIYLQRRRRFLKAHVRQLRLIKYTRRVLPYRRPTRKLRTSYYFNSAKYRQYHRGSLALAITRTLARYRRLRVHLRKPIGALVTRRKRPRRTTSVAKAAAVTTPQPAANKPKPVKSAAARRITSRRQLR